MNDNEKKYLWHLKRKFHTEEYYESYETVWGNNWRITSKGYDFINHHFYELTQVYELEITKEWFESYIKEAPNRYHSPYRKLKTYYKYGNWKASWDSRNRTTKFIRQPHHQKKVLSEKEIANREYHERKGSNKDRRKTYWKRGAGKFYKRYSNQKHRAWQKEKISNGDYCFSDTDYKYFCDPWLWD
jgi:hypothetical protein